MNQHGMSEGEAYKHLKLKIQNAWKVINEESLKLSNVAPKAVVHLVVNFSSVIELMYANFADKYTNPVLLKDHIAAVIMDPIDN